MLDTSVLWPSRQRDFLLSLAVEGMYRPLWSTAILEELEYHQAQKLIRRGAAEDAATQRARHLIDRMRMVFDDALVVDWESLEGSFDLPDPDDEHVVAAAVVAGADAIVTHNLKDFPAPRSLRTSMWSRRRRSWPTLSRSHLTRRFARWPRWRHATWRRADLSARC